jgi:hypothetical protein
MPHPDIEVIQQLKLLPQVDDSINSSWIKIWNDEIQKGTFCLITFYNIQEYLSEDDLNWCNILTTNALPEAIGRNICNVLKLNLNSKTIDPYNEDILWNMKIYRSIAKKYWPEIDTMYRIVLDAKKDGQFDTHL